MPSQFAVPGRALARLALYVAVASLAACTTPPPARPNPAQAAPTPPTAVPPTATAATPKSLEGTWVVDLRGAPGDEPYTQPFVVVAIDEAERSLRGSFYNSDISWSRINTAWDKVVITFITSDGAGEYVHTATLQGDTLVGSSTARHRNLLVPWMATRDR